MSGDVFPPPLRAFIRRFNRGHFWESHEVLEDAWRECGSAFYHGLILYASAFVHLERNNAHGIRAQMEKARRALSDVPSPYLGVDVDGIRRHARSVVETVKRLRDDPPDRWSERVSPPTLSLDPDRTSGTETERSTTSGR